MIIYNIISFFRTLKVRLKKSVRTGDSSKKKIKGTEGLNLSFPSVKNSKFSTPVIVRQNWLS